MNRIASTLLVAAVCAVPLTADTVIYGVEDLNVADTQLFELNVTTGWYQEIGPLYLDTDVEAITWMWPSIVGYEEPDGTQQKFIDLDFTAGSWTVINSTPFTSPDLNEARGMATDEFGTVWAFVADYGFCIVAANGDCTLMIPSTLAIEGLAAVPDGSILYGMRNNGRIYEVIVATGDITQIANLSVSGVENLEMASPTELAFFEDDDELEYCVYDLVSEELTVYELTGVDLSDIEGFVYADPWVPLERTTWGELKALYQ